VSNSHVTRQTYVASRRVCAVKRRTGFRTHVNLRSFKHCEYVAVLVFTTAFCSQFTHQQSSVVAKSAWIPHTTSIRSSCGIYCLSECCMTLVNKLTLIILYVKATERSPMDSCHYSTSGFPLSPQSFIPFVLPLAYVNQPKTLVGSRTYSNQHLCNTECLRGYVMAQAFSHRPLAWSPGFSHKSDRVEFVAVKVALEQVYLRVLPFCPVNIIASMLHTHSLTYHRYYTKLATNSVVM
jgi:hypothetical protein